MNEEMKVMVNAIIDEIGRVEDRTNVSTNWRGVWIRYSMICVHVEFAEEEILTGGQSDGTYTF